ncbi:hypothetical protein E8E11_007004 [Didymella keratinophila]|nr:hypothetical protein E8E11_007004 [Didymella keratinophila]
MNVLINNKVRQGQFMEAWQIYKALTGDETHEGQIAWVSLHDETDSARRQFSLSDNNAKNMARLKYTYKRIRDRKFKELCAWGGMDFPMTEADAGDLELEVISEFVRVILLGSHEPEVVELMIQDAQQAIGVEKLPTGDVSAFDLTGQNW